MNEGIELTRWAIGKLRRSEKQSIAAISSIVHVYDIYFLVAMNYFENIHSLPTQVDNLSSRFNFIRIVLIAR